MKNKYFLIIFLTCFPLILKALPFESRNISVSGPSPYLKPTVERIYKLGGNVVDIAVASAFTLTVVTPFYVSLGAGGFLLADLGEKNILALDFRETAPKELRPDYYKDKSSLQGGTAVGVPGFTAGMWSFHKKYGKLPWRLLFKEAIRLAEKGHIIHTEWASITKKVQILSYGMDMFFNQGKPYKVGETFKQKKVAKALKIIRDKNIKGFYKGKIAKSIVQQVKISGGSMTLDDLKNYQVRWLEPIKKDFMGYTVYSMPPPSSGGLVLSSALDLIAKKNLQDKKPLSSMELHLLSEIMSRSFRIRTLIADPDFHSVPEDKILSKDYLKKMARSISIKKTKNLEPLKETTHLVVMNNKGHTVSMTLTLNLNYGSKVVDSKYGIVLNNQMDDFTTKINQPNAFGLIQGEGNKVEGGKRPLSSMSPTIVKKNDQTILALGASGGPKIISAVLQTLYRTLVNKLNIDQAIQFPRIHHQFLPRKTYLEKNRFSPDLLKILSKKNHNIEEVKHLGKVYGIHKGEDEILRSAFDSRGDGAAWGM